MRSLFTKILLWFFLTVIVTFTATFYISSIFVRSRQPEFTRFTFELREARTAWEAEGSAGLSRFLARLKDATGASRADRRQWPGPADRPRSVERRFAIRGDAAGAASCLFLFFFRIENGRGFSAVTLSRDHKYCFVATFPVLTRTRAGASRCPRETWWMLAHLRAPLLRARATSDGAAAARCRRRSSVSGAAIFRRA